MQQARNGKRILFVCIGNMIRSQMAEGFAREYGGAFMNVYSAGLYPTGVVSEEAIVAMGEKGIDIGKQSSKGLRDVPLEEMDYVVSLTSTPARDMCPPSFDGKAIDIPIEDPLGRSLEFFRVARDEIDERVKALIKDIWEGKC